MFHFLLFLVHLFHCVNGNSDFEYRICAGGEDFLLLVEGRPYVWNRDTSEYDPPSTSACSPFGLDYICSKCAPSGCTYTDAVLCAAPIAYPPLASTPANTFQVVSYNILLLDYLYNLEVLGIPRMYQYTGQRERSCRIPIDILWNQIKTDVIVFQEVFMGTCFPCELEIEDLLTYYGFKYFTSIVGVEEENENEFLFENGGVFIASRWPIEYYEDYVFMNSDPTTGDSFGSKGVMYARVLKSDDIRTVPYHVFATHMQAEVGDGPTQAIRELQATEMSEFIAGRGISSSEPVIMAGDFNADLNNSPDHTWRVLENMGALLPTIVGPLRTTWDPTINEFNAGFQETDEPRNQWLDYVVLSSSHLTTNVMGNLTVYKPQNLRFTVCIDATTGGYVSPSSPDCQETLDVYNLSDHFAVIGWFIFPDY